MEAISAASLPEGPGWQYEPKWDGFRCLAFKDSERVELHSKSAKLLTAAFPDIADALRALKPATFVLDGELVIPVNGVLSFDHLLARFSRSGGSRQQAAEHPAVLFVFDILAEEAEELADKPLSFRRTRLERFSEQYLNGDKGTIRLSPATTDIEVARKWLELAGTSLDGVIAKRLDLPYQPGTSKGMLKIKRLRTVDCVVGGIIYGGSKTAVSHILLGLYEGELLHFIGSAPLRGSEGKKLAAIVEDAIEPPGFTGKKPGQVLTQFGHRVGEWHPLKPVLVAEVQYDHFTGNRFRHGAKFVRWRPDKNAAACSVTQVLERIEQPS
jgi:ATP-dependent DNA ligase